MLKPEDFKIYQSNILGFELKAYKQSKYYCYITYLNTQKTKKNRI